MEGSQPSLESLHSVGETTEGGLSGKQGFCGDWVSKNSAKGFWEVSGVPTLALVLETLAFLVSQLVGAVWHMLDGAGFQFQGSSTPLLPLPPPGSFCFLPVVGRPMNHWWDLCRIGVQLIRSGWGPRILHF